MVQVTRSYHINGSDRLAVFRNRRWLHTYRILTSLPCFNHCYPRRADTERASIVMPEMNLSAITTHSRVLETVVNDTYQNAFSQVEHTALGRLRMRSFVGP